MFSRNSNSESTNFTSEYLLWFFFSTGKLRKKLFWTNKKFVFFVNCSNWERFEDKIGEPNWWKYLINSLYVSPLYRRARIGPYNNEFLFFIYFFFGLSKLWICYFCADFYPNSNGIPILKYLHRRNEGILQFLR